MASLSRGTTGWLHWFIWLNQTAIYCFVAEPWTV